MKNKMLQMKEWAMTHKKQIIIGAGLVVVAAIGGKAIVKKMKAVEVGDEAIEELTGGIIEQVTIDGE